MTAQTPFLEMTDLTISVRLRGGGRGNVVDRVSLNIPAGGTVGLVGESGSGKTMTSLAIMGLLPPGARVESGEIRLGGENLLSKTPQDMQRIRGKKVAMVMQDAMTALNPCFTIRGQLAPSLRQHRHLAGAVLEDAVVNSLEQVHLPAPLLGKF